MTRVKPLAGEARSETRTPAVLGWAMTCGHSSKPLQLCEQMWSRCGPDADVGRGGKVEACDLLSLVLGVRGWAPLPSALQGGMLLARGYLPWETMACVPFLQCRKGGEPRRGEERYGNGLREPTRALLHSLLSAAPYPFLTQRCSEKPQASLSFFCQQ